MASGEFSYNEGWLPLVMKRTMSRSMAQQAHHGQGCRRSRIPRSWTRRIPDAAALLPFLLTALFAGPVYADPVLLSPSDFSLGLGISSEAGAWAALDTGSLDGVFGPHRCQCPQNLAALLQLTTTGQTNVGNSVIGVTFTLGDNCAAASTSCTLLGEASFSTSQEASAPQFSSKAIFEAATGSTSPDCTHLSAGSTTLWAILTQDAKPLSFALSVDLPVSGTTVGAPTGVTAVPANEALLVSWSPPKDASLVAGYQVLCLPRPTSALAAGYESCGHVSNPSATVLTPDDGTQICSAALSASARSVRITGLSNDSAYSVAVVAIDVSGGTSAPSSPAVVTPQPTVSFWDKYKQAGGAASGCSQAPVGAAGVKDHLTDLVLVTLSVLILLHGRRGGRQRARPVGLLLLLLLASTARAQESTFEERTLKEPLFEEKQAKSDMDFAESRAPAPGSSPNWGVQLGVSLYRPDVDSEFGDGKHPYADTFSSSRHLLSFAELDRYLLRRFGTWGLGLRAGYYRASAAAFLADGVTRSGDQTRLRLIPFSLSLLYFANGLPGLRAIPLIPYAKTGLDGTVWTASSTGEGSSHTGWSTGWHATAGLLLGLGWMASSPSHDNDIAAPCALFFEWSYAAINGLGVSHALHVGDNTWFAGIAFDI